MKLCWAVLLGVLTLCSSTATSSPQVTSDASTPRPSSDCRYPQGDYTKVWDKGATCAEAGATPTTAKLFQFARSVEEYRVFFADYCQHNASAVRSCIAEQLVRFETCHNDKRVTLFKIYRAGLETMLDGGCVEGGGKLATLFDGLLRMLVNGTVDKAEVVNCVLKTTYVFEAVEGTANMDLASIIYILYQELPKFRECVSKVDLEGQFAAVADWFMGEIIRTAQCVDPNSGELMACGDIVASSLRSPTVCAVKAAQGSVYDALERDTVDCYRDAEDFHIFEDANATRREFSVYCERNSLRAQCAARNHFVADLCLDASEHAKLNVTDVALRSALVNACFDEGERINDVMFEVDRLEKTNGTNAFRECIDVAMATRQQQTSLVPKSLRLYREAVTFKGCLLEKLGGDQKSVVAATSLMKGLLSELMCVHPEDGTSVRCETLATAA